MNTEGKMILYIDKEKIIGELQYEFNGIELFINSIEIKKEKANIPIKLMNVLLLYLISLYSDKGLKEIGLNADSSYEYKNIKDYDEKELENKRKGKEYCLPCYYEKMGFSYVKDNFNKEIYKLQEACKKKLRNYKNYYEYKDFTPSYLICTCQKYMLQNEFQINGLKFDSLKIKMKAIFPHLLKELKEVLKELKSYC